MKRKKTGKIRFAVTVAVLLSAILAGGLLAKYRSDNKRQAELVAAQFHISSDYLDDESERKRYEITDWKDGFDIQLCNYEKKNTALIAETDITYTVTLSDSSKWTYTDNSNGTLKKSEDKVAQSIHINPQNGVVADDTITVTVTTKTPFVRTLKAEFVMKGKNQPAYTVSDETDGIVRLTIRSGGYSGNVTVQWASGKYAPDNTNPLMENWKNSTDTNTSQSLTVEKNTTYELLFFKTSEDSKNATTSGSGTSIKLT